jgi:hypothetical protein
VQETAAFLVEGIDFFSHAALTPVENGGDARCRLGSAVLIPILIQSHGHAAQKYVGQGDSEFVGYGFDDDDYCIRASEAGWYTAVTPLLHIKHGTGGNVLDRGKNWSCSFAREEKERPSNMDVFLKKYPHLRSR